MTDRRRNSKPHSVTRGLAALGAGAVAILAQSDLEEDEARQEHEAEPDQHKGEHLAGGGGEHRRGHDPEHDEHSG